MILKLNIFKITHPKLRALYILMFHITTVDAMKKLFEYNSLKVLGNPQVLEVFQARPYSQNLHIAY